MPGYYTFLTTLGHKFLFNYLQLWRSYAILSATTQFTSYAQNVQHQLKCTLGGRTFRVLGVVSSTDFNPASYPQQDGKWLVAYGLRGEGLVWLFGAVVYLSYSRYTIGSSCSLSQALGNVWPHNAPRYHQLIQLMPISCSEIVKRCWSSVYSCKQRCRKYQELYFFFTLQSWELCYQRQHHLLSPYHVTVSKYVKHNASIPDSPVFAENTSTPTIKCLQ